MPRSLLLVFALSLPLLAAVVSAAPPRPRPSLDSTVPPTHWAYEAFSCLANEGLCATYPDGTLSGRRAFTRRQFAEFTRQILVEGEQISGVGWMRGKRLRARWGVDTAARDPLTMLYREFRPEIAAIGTDMSWSDGAAASFTELCRTGRPQGVNVPLVGSPGVYDPEAREQGRRLARREWVSGARVLLSSEPVVRWKWRVPAAFRWEPTPVEVAKGARGQFAVGHNREMWRLQREYADGSPGSPDWLAAVTDLRAVWRRGRRRVARLDAEHPRIPVPNTSVLLTFSPNREVWERFGLEDTGGKGTWEPLAISWEPLPSLEVLLGPPDSGIYFLRGRVKGDSELPHRIYAVDMGSGVVLNAIAAP